RTAAAGRQSDARGMEGDRRRPRHETARRAGALSRTRSRVGRQEPARGNGRDVHDSKAQAPAVALQMPWYDQRHREPAQSGVQKRTSNVTRWRNGEMVERWVSTAWLLTEKHFRKVIGHRDF